MKKVVIYQSGTGFTAKYAGWIAERLGCEATLMATKPEMAVELAVKGMLPKNKIGDASFGRLKVYAGPEHKQSAQTPIAVEVK